MNYTPQFSARKGGGLCDFLPPSADLQINDNTTQKSYAAAALFQTPHDLL